MSTHRFTDLGSVVEDIHALFDAWADAGTFRPPLDGDGEIVLRLAVHEWVANLVQHAAFDSAEAEICLEISTRHDAVQVAIDDTSRGFDLLGQLEEQHIRLHGPAPSERGRGLLMLITCTDDLDYRPAASGRQRLSFAMRNPGEAIFAGLFDSSEYPSDPRIIPPDEFFDVPPGGDGLPSLPTTSQPSSR